MTCSRNKAISGKKGTAGLRKNALWTKGGTKCALLSLAVLVCMDGGAKNGDGKAEETIKVDTCSADTFSYAVGIANTKGLKNYIAVRMNVDTAYMENFIEGFNASLPEVESKKLQAYVAGLQIRRQVEEQVIPGIERQMSGNDSAKVLNRNLFREGFYKALAGLPTRMSMREAEEMSQRQMRYYHDADVERRYGENRRMGEAFLKANAGKDSVLTLPCGVQYKVLTQGEGEVPASSSKVKVNYEGRLVDGTVFDSSYECRRPASFVCNQVIKGWTEALTRMPVGSKWEIYIPQELGYGSHEAGKIPPFSALIFTVELLEIEK